MIAAVTEVIDSGQDLGEGTSAGGEEKSGPFSNGSSTIQMMNAPRLATSAIVLRLRFMQA
eukprot:2525031-Amphidinium_carterae.1